MNEPHIFLRVAALASSLLLVGGLVLHRSGVFDRLLEADMSAVAPSVAGALVSMTASDPDTSLPRQQDDSTWSSDDTSGAFARRFPILKRDTIRGVKAHWSSSKSAPDIIRFRLFDTSQRRDPDTSEQEETIREESADTMRRLERFMGGSKSLAPIFESSTPDSQKSTSSSPSKNDP